MNAKALAAPRPTFTPLPEQAEIISAVAGRDSVMVEAGAGCGKSSTLALAAPGVKTVALALAFNKSIAEGMARTLPANFTTKTMNGLGHGAWMRSPAIGEASVKLEARKLGLLVSEIAKARGLSFTTEQWSGCRELVEKVMQWGLVPKGDIFAEASMVPDHPDTWTSAAEELWIDRLDQPMIIDVAQQVLERDIEMARAGVISFDDQLYCSVLLGGKFPQFPVLFIDENQDLNSMQHAMLARAVRPDGRIISVGDRRQSIYGFRGARGDSAEQIRLLRPEGTWTDLPLMTSFRCPVSVVERQREHVPAFRAAPWALPGTVKRLVEQRPWDTPIAEGEHVGWGWKDITDALAALPQGSERAPVILCRNNGPLLAMAFKLIRRGIGVKMLGRELGKGLITLSKKIAPEDGCPVDTVAGLVREWMESEAALARANGNEGKIDGIRDRGECLLAVLESGVARDAQGLRVALDRLFARQDGLVTLGSIHRSKGLEWDLVLLLDPWRLPSRQAKEAAKLGDFRPMEQERNLKYVAETRTKHTLLLGNLEDFS